MSRLVMRITDEHGAVNPARVSVSSLERRQVYWPRSEHLRYDIVESWGEERSFVCDGQAELDVPPGEYEIAAARGPEFTLWHSTVTVGPGHPDDVDVEISRWIDMP